MPGLPTRPCFFDIDIDTETEEIYGLMWSSNRYSIQSQDLVTIMIDCQNGL